jgi:2-polyprenyl-3-methyl-5-hydroxy-6-metoxy-1,4-benzoquinol methylase
MDLHEIPTQAFKRHPWEMARARFFSDLLTSSGVLAGHSHILDVGAGDGFVARRLAAELPPGASIVCFDVHYTDEHLAQLRAEDPQNVSFTRERPPGTFDVLLLLDVLEHVASDAEFLGRLVADHLVHDGAVLVSVPAWAWLYTRHDVALGHYRRYRPSSLRRMAEAAGLKVVLQGGLFHSLLVARVAQKLNELRAGVRSIPDPERFRVGAQTAAAGWAAGRLLTAALEFCLVAEGRLSRAMAGLAPSLPGLSAWILCRRA